MGAGIVQTEIDDQDTVLKRVSKIASGGIEGIYPEVIKKEDIEKVKSAVDSAKSKAKSEDATSGDMSKAAFAVAAYRDLRYAVSGRKFIRIAGLSGKAYAAWGRMHAFDWADSED